MATESKQTYRHFILEGVTQTEIFQSSGGGSQSTIPKRDRTLHARELQRQIVHLKEIEATACEVQQGVGLEDGRGIQVEFESYPDIELAFERLAREQKGIELLNVRKENNIIHAVVFVPEGKLVHFEKLIRDYLSEKRDINGRHIDNQRLIDAIHRIRAASLRALWTDTSRSIPAKTEEPLWWEVWLSNRNQTHKEFTSFRHLAAQRRIEVLSGELNFPERTVLLVRASVSQLHDSILILNSIAEIRQPSKTADFFDSLPPERQHEWIDKLLDQIRFTPPGNEIPYICLLDTGVNRGHPLLIQAISDKDLHTVEPAWGSEDDDGHGSEMAGLALVGNLTESLKNADAIEVSHRLESVKLLPHDGSGGTDALHHGFLTTEAVNRPEVIAPDRLRIFSMSVTSEDNRNRGRPSAWSATMDSLAVDFDGDGANPRLLVVSAGNINDNFSWSNYPDSNETNEVHDPAQAWNSLAVGSYTELVNITETSATDYSPIAPDGGLSPFSSTSMTWHSRSPFKPDVVCEGGNAAKDAFGCSVIPSLSLLTTHHRPNDRLLTTTNATSASTALASRMAAQVMAEYPRLWPETVRALIVHSAEWTDQMKRMFLPSDAIGTKDDYQNLVKRCGFGVPNLKRALWSVSNSLTMVVEANLQPFKKDTGKQPATCEMNLHNLPWPVDILEKYGDTPVEMRVTLSYFIEPNPSRRGDTSLYRYASHGLRFDVKRPLETVDAFRGRINAAARNKNSRTGSGSDDPLWLIGTQRRHRGSLHADIWRGSAAELANRGYIAVFPATGWWRTRPKLERYDSTARYSLIISIRAPKSDIALYASVANEIDSLVAVGT